MSLTTEQLAQRLDYITGTDASVICGVSPWGNIIDLWRYKTRLAQAPDISDNPSIRAGNYLEPAVAQWFSDETGKGLTKSPELIVHKNISWMAGNVDRLVEGEDAILEIKTSSFDKGWGEYGENIIPDYYLCQVAHYLAVTDRNIAYIAVLIGGKDFRWYTHERNQKLEDKLIQKEKEFWDCVQNQVAPTPRSAKEMIALYGSDASNETIVANGEIERQLDELRELKAVIKDYQDKQQKLEDSIKVYMGQRDTLVSTSGKIAATWKKTKGRTSFDADALKQQNKELYERYLKEGQSYRTFRVK